MAITNETLRNWCQWLNIEVFYAGPAWPEGQGWYWWSCCPGCLPDADASGPFATERECLLDAVGDWEPPASRHQPHHVQ